MAETLSIPRRFNGPPDSGHGGYSAGLVALLLGGGPAAASLRIPPPLETPLEVHRDGEVAELRLGSGDAVARAEPARLEAPPPPPVTPDEAAAAEPDPHELAVHHPFPTCFGCGPLRDRREALRLFAGPLPGRDGLYAARWIPQPDLADAGGTVRPLFVWAALDCPSAGPGMRTGVPTVLARLAVELERPVRAGEPHAITSRLDHADGRKRFTAVALYDAEGTRLARGEALWIELPRRAP